MGSSSTIKCLPFGQNLVKIGLVDPEIIGLQEIIKKLTETKHIVRRAKIVLISPPNFMEIDDTITKKSFFGSLAAH